MNKYFWTIIVSLLVGFLLSLYMVNQYESVDIKPVFNKTETLYLLQQGVYSSEESMKKYSSNLPSYIYSLIDNMYHVYVAISLKNDNIIKLQEYYKNKNIKTIIKTTSISNTELINSLDKYDLVINQTDDSKTIDKIIQESLSKYKEG